MHREKRLDEMNYRHHIKRMLAWRYLMAMPRSLWYNLRLLSWKQARRLPILISNRTSIDALTGKVEINASNLLHCSSKHLDFKP